MRATGPGRHAERALALLMAQSATPHTELTVIGGLNPPLLAPVADAPHQGTVDVDLALELAQGGVRPRVRGPAHPDGPAAAGAAAHRALPPDRSHDFAGSFRAALGRLLDVDAEEVVTFAVQRQLDGEAADELLIRQDVAAAAEACLAAFDACAGASGTRDLPGGERAHGRGW